MVKTTRPIHRNVTLVAVESGGTFHATTGTDTTELKKPVKYWTVITNVVFALLLGVGLHVIRGDLGEKVDIFISVELGHLEFGGRLRTLQVLALSIFVVTQRALLT